MINQNQVVEALKKPEAYYEKPKKILVEQTHISYIFLTEKFVYKVKKAVDFGFLDFTTLLKRKFFCEKELELNQRLCADMYLEVVPITKSETQIRINGKGDIIEYAVKMRRIPQDKMMRKLLEKGNFPKNIIDKIAKIIVDFHIIAKIDEKIKQFGSISTIRTNWVENFNQTKEYIGITLSQKNYNYIHNKVNGFIQNNKLLFQKRVAENRIKECHGDIHSGNIFIADKIYIFDAIEFNERFRYSDIVSDVAFLAMDLDIKGKKELSDFFVEKYIQYSKDQELKKLLPFYKCYRAYVRGKVTSFKLKDTNILKQEKNLSKKEASKYFDLALEYATIL
jgi:aminoglycoside phosphotransferase family enzyme